MAHNRLVWLVALPLGTKIKGWTIDGSLGATQCGIYTVYKKEQRAIMKYAPKDTESLAPESNFYMKHATHKIIENFKSVRSLPFLGIPVALEYGIYLRKFQHIVLPHFKSTVWSLFNENGQKMPMHTLFRLAIQMINAYEFVHSRKLIHGDLSGNHIMIDDSGMAYLIDYTSALPYVTETYKENPKYFDHGTREYCSYDMHLGIPTMRGDMETLGYNLLHWCTGSLPWINMWYGTTKEAKREFLDNLQSMRSLLPYEQLGVIVRYFEYVSKLKFDQIPDYSYVRTLFKDALHSVGKKDEGGLEFETKTYEFEIELDISSDADVNISVVRKPSIV